jgi:diguanylate cyclase (GGDEF)-like protein
MLALASSLGAIPYAPLLIDIGSAHQNLSWLTATAVIVAPHLVLIVGAATVSILRWQEREERVKYLSHTDVLTNVANRRHLMELFDKEVERSMRENTPISFMMMDLDHFKKVNDTFGHQAGDIVIKSAAKVLKDSTRKVDFVGRYGGEEFACVLPNTNQDQAMLTAQRCRENMENSVIVDDEGNQIPMTSSIGVDTFYPSQASCIADAQSVMEQILRQADQALYLAKESGRNKAIHHKDSV